MSVSKLKKETGIYIHIPFCKSKCYYCDFVSYPNKSEHVQSYIQCLKKEIDAKLNSVNSLITSIYIGGGTPSFIDSKYIKEIIDAIYAKCNIVYGEEAKLVDSYNELTEKTINTADGKDEGHIENSNNSAKKNVNIAKSAEITIEVNPGTVTRQKLEDYKNAGINRLSIGLQSCNDVLLKQIGRIHTFEDFLYTYNLARELKFSNINVDLMLGLPNQKLHDLEESLREVINLNPEHISVYSLILEENTKLFDMVNNGIVTLPQDDAEREMYWYVKNTLELNGYKHYEISNFAKPGHMSVHNLNCWEQQEYIGLGVSAHSYMNNTRFFNTSNVEEYIGNIESGNIEKNKTVAEVQSFATDKEKEFMLLGLRKIDGVSVQGFKARFGENPLYLYRDALSKLDGLGLIIVDADKIKLTNKGIDFANLVWEEFV